MYGSYTKLKGLNKILIIIRVLDTSATCIFCSFLKILFLYREHRRLQLILLLKKGWGEQSDKLKTSVKKKRLGWLFSNKIEEMYKPRKELNIKNCEWF